MAGIDHTAPRDDPPGTARQHQDDPKVSLSHSNGASSPALDAASGTSRSRCPLPIHTGSTDDPHLHISGEHQQEGHPQRDLPPERHQGLFSRTSASVSSSQET
ncbi:hypothetical protein J5N97_019887 [Dioscorea zingiberensis]|uniref:Uncharacterized protein n=1 Tax=Dioscorea zingiberensis TaxID=325984 RepID=A0A9D5HDA7_9LILI|nr:hypothetical protein J5N97_019887 [Dioscorea zingiberensis]